MTEPSPHDLAVGLALGTIDSRAAIAWADMWIARLEDPPCWLIEISTAGSQSAYDILNLIPDGSRAGEPTDIEFLGAMAIRYIDQGESLRRLVPLLMDRFCFSDWTGTNDVRSAIYLIEDELDWDAAQAARTATEFFGKYLEDGRRQLAKTMAKPYQSA